MRTEARKAARRPAPDADAPPCTRGLGRLVAGLEVAASPGGGPVPATWVGVGFGAMDFIDDLRRVPTFVPPGWIVYKNMLFDWQSFSPGDLSPAERLFYDEQIRDASLLFAAASPQRVGTKNYEAHCYLGGGGGGYDYQFKIKRAKQTVFNDVCDDLDDVHEAANRASAFMFAWHWHPERLLGGG